MSAFELHIWNTYGQHFCEKPDVRREVNNKSLCYILPLSGCFSLYCFKAVHILHIIWTGYNLNDQVITDTFLVKELILGIWFVWLFLVLQYADWESGRTCFYYCHVYGDGSYSFKVCRFKHKYYFLSKPSMHLHFFFLSDVWGSFLIEHYILMLICNKYETLSVCCDMLQCLVIGIIA